MMERKPSFGSRPSTGSSVSISRQNSLSDLEYPSRPDTAYSSRPTTSSGSRPGTATGSHNSLSGPELLGSGVSTLQREADQDSLLRIMNENSTKANDEFIMLAEKGDAVKIRTIVEHGINVSKFRGLNGYTPLHHACNRGHGNVVSVLLSANIPVDSKNDSGETPLHLAAYMGHLLIVEQLLDCGANINSCNEYDETPLFYAARRNMPVLVRLLLQRNANADLVDVNDEKAIEHTEDPRTLSMFAETIPQDGDSAVSKMSHIAIQNIYSFLKAKEIGSASCVCGKWHRASESDEVWAKVGLRRWELALQGSLGFGATASSSFRPKLSRPPKPGSSRNLKK
mmetsp:Transcript_7290/g.12240  ORF Transcript_7290/g.12240 Transcript_7290/m.12240 type:complete len:340 (-) Transcript_7290:251-1270(-)|eukprot:CAMPEP_0114432266 /NCGR_PEP_ID=MMETSP0103-20121206/11062_1 /TAXON_ID=37642 ORGANISM="Paraphysomonas imperforata, Strain PA2" /NCGR_SAMPLE_ID=MMETSP0103 /ASSEMBLY_ACC=CAM_ASM_000201 /LENGTH=339 /DNA_ID=CAMNT_0001601927 /DNA_START=83 /DNA_END=1102 /DNA_ORIENTATION=-